MTEPIPGTNDQSMSPISPKSAEEQVAEKLQADTERFARLLEDCDGEVTGSDEYAKSMMVSDSPLKEWIRSKLIDISSSEADNILRDNTQSRRYYYNLMASELPLILNKVIRGEDLLHPGILRLQQSDNAEPSYEGVGEYNHESHKRVIESVKNADIHALKTLIGGYETYINRFVGKYDNVKGKDAEAGQRRDWLEAHKQVTGHMFDPLDPTRWINDQTIERMDGVLGNRIPGQQNHNTWSANNELAYQKHVDLGHEVEKLYNFVEDFEPKKE